MDSTAILKAMRRLIIILAIFALSDPNLALAVNGLQLIGFSAELTALTTSAILPTIRQMLKIRQAFRPSRVNISQTYEWSPHCTLYVAKLPDDIQGRKKFGWAKDSHSPEEGFQCHSFLSVRKIPATSNCITKTGAVGSLWSSALVNEDLLAFCKA
jgi:hypothetical protein